MVLIPAEIILKKRRGFELTTTEISFFINGFTEGLIPDYQMSALLMAICFQGMSDSETSHLTETMIKSGRKLNFSHLNKIAVDKHSTGGVGDKTSIILCPLVAAAGVPIPMMAGRGLGHTGGTLDKLESIKGFNVRLSLDRFQSQVASIGGSLIGQTTEICPADLKLYSLRDVTGTVDSIPLICASIMSKKIAEGIGGLVLDVKFGTGAFMPTIDQARTLAGTLKRVGEQHGLRVLALLTNMNQPLGRWVGNACEIQECLEIMKDYDAGVEHYPDTVQLTEQLAARLFLASGRSPSIQEGLTLARELLRSGAALQKFWEIAKAQGAQGSWDWSPRGEAFEVRAMGEGWLGSLDTRKIGLAGILIGAGRVQSSDLIDHDASIEVLAKIGDRIERGQILFKIYAKHARLAGEAGALIESGIEIHQRANAPLPLVADTLDI